MRTLPLLVLLSISIAPLNVLAGPDKQECTAVKEKIRTIRAKMRAGYTRAQGERLEQRLRKLRIARAKACR